MTRFIVATVIAAFVFVALVPQAEARRVIHHRTVHHYAVKKHPTHYAAPPMAVAGHSCDQNSGRQCVAIGYQGNDYTTRTVPRRAARTYYGSNESGDSPAASLVSRGYASGGRPAGCPHAWCGCGTSLHVYGKIVPSLNLASNWGRFPSAAPGPGMVAYRNHHVKVITGYANGGYTCYDPNSTRGGGSYSGPCSISGYRIVNPHVGRYAQS